MFLAAPLCRRKVVPSSRSCRWREGTRLRVSGLQYLYHHVIQDLVGSCLSWTLDRIIVEQL